MQTKVVWSTALFATVLLGLASARAADPAGASVEQQITKMENDWADSYVKRDSSFAQKNTTDDFTYIGPDGNAVSKADYVKGLTGNTIFTAFKITSVKVRIYGDAAVAVGIVAISANTKGEDESGDYAFTDVFVKQKGEWKAASSQVTQVAKDQATE